MRLILKAAALLDGKGMMLHDENGEILPGQVAVSTQMQPVDGEGMESFVTVTFQIDGESVRVE